MAAMGFNIQYSMYAQFGNISKHQRAASQYHHHEKGLYSLAIGFTFYCPLSILWNGVFVI
eukprot:scaffold8419_cov62-Attheya_sp.AAC.10